MNKVFIYEKHNEVLEAWAKYRKTTNDIPNLITLDHHTDVLEAFCNSAFDWDRNREDFNKKKKLLNLLNYNDLNSIKKAIAYLRNDEHIDAAIRANIVNKAFVISHNGSTDNPPPNEYTKIWNDKKKLIELMMNKIALPTKNLTYPISSNGIYVVGCSDIDENMVLDSKFINKKIKVIDNMNRSRFFESSFILDIDLDYFHTVASVNNGDLETFYELINKSVLITIAKESPFVDVYNSKDNEINSDILLDNILKHIANALNFA